MLTVITKPPPTLDNSNLLLSRAVGVKNVFKIFDIINEDMLCWMYLYFLSYVIVDVMYLCYAGCYVFYVMYAGGYVFMFSMLCMLDVVYLCYA